MKLTAGLRFLHAFTRGVRPIRVSLNSIATSLDTIARIQQFRLVQEGMVIPDEKMQKSVGKDDMTEISYKVQEPPDPDSGTPEEEELPAADWMSTAKALFGPRSDT